MQSITSVKVDFYSDTGAMNYLNYGGDSYGTASAEDYIAYMFASVEGYSKVGSYTGLQPFVYTGMKCKWLMVKNITSGGNSWHLTIPTEGNVQDTVLLADSSLAEQSFTWVDLLSNGFKIRAASGSRGVNHATDTYIFYAVAESPLKTANAR
jgi:hypothetical protein